MTGPAFPPPPPPRTDQPPVSDSSSGSGIHGWPARVGAYEIEALLGAGGMGRVFRARQQPLGRGVALKVLDARLAASDPEYTPGTYYRRGTPGSHRLGRPRRAARGSHPGRDRLSQRHRDPLGHARAGALDGHANRLALPRPRDRHDRLRRPGRAGRAARRDRPAGLRGPRQARARRHHHRPVQAQRCLAAARQLAAAVPEAEPSREADLALYVRVALDDRPRLPARDDRPTAMLAHVRSGGAADDAREALAAAAREDLFVGSLARLDSTLAPLIDR